jgi:hypothetical protein
MGEANQSVKATLRDFIDTQSKLVTSIAAFIALTVFGGQLDDGSGIKIFISALTLSAAILLTWELLINLPEPPREWRVELFSHILSLLTIFMVWLWFSKFPAAWVPLAGLALTMLVFFGLAILSTYPLKKLSNILAGKLIKRPLRLNETNRHHDPFVVLAICSAWPRLPAVIQT